MKPQLSIVFIVIMFVTGSLSAHHNFAAHYMTDTSVTVTGVVTQFRFVNPHARVYIDAKNDDGTVVSWMAEGDASVALRRSGWANDQLKPGDVITITGNPSHAGENMMGWNNITLSDGSEIGGGDGRLLERLRILNDSLAEYRRQR